MQTESIVKPLYADARSGIIFNFVGDILIDNETLSEGVIMLPVKNKADKSLTIEFYNVNGKKMQKQNIIGHELCHTLLTDHAELKGLRLTEGVVAYGHDRLPDWFDEISAIMSDNKKLSEMKQRAWEKNIIPFSDFFVMENPAMQLIRNQIAQKAMLTTQEDVKVH